MRPISGGGMCQRGTRTGGTRAIESALNASKNVALPMTTRARTNQRDVDSCSMRSIKAAAASSATNGDAGDGTMEASGSDSALAMVKGFLPVRSVFGRLYRPARLDIAASVV